VLIFFAKMALGIINTHSVSRRPGKTALTLIFGPWLKARVFISCKPAALVTEYAMLLPIVEIPYD